MVISIPSLTPLSIGYLGQGQIYISTNYNIINKYEIPEQIP